MKKNKKYERIGETLPALLRSIESAYKDDGHRIWEVWDQAVGPELARRVQPHKFKNGLLTVAVEGASWLQQIVFLAPKIIDSVNLCLGNPLVQRIKGVASVIKPSEAAEIEQKLIRDEPVSEWELAAIEAELSAIRDGAVKDAARNARIAALIRHKPGADR